MISDDIRCKRFYDYHSSDKDIRTEFQHDYDRLIYSDYLRRLACVTQIFNPSEGVIFHNRLTHTLKVSQIANRISQIILNQYSVDELNEIGGLNSDVVSAAALAHDLGNPPFGHAAESELDDLIKNEENILDGFEGNAQSFRIVTELCAHNKNYRGLNLTRATLNAILKYPWARENETQKKFGVYSTEEKYFQFAREFFDGFDKKQCLEASIMDISDDITYAIHDLTDLLKQGLIPFYQLSEKINVVQEYGEESYKSERLYPQFSMVFNLIDTLSNNNYSEKWAPDWNNDRKVIITKLKIFFNKFNLLIPDTNYKGYFIERALLKDMEDIFIKEFFDNLRINISPCENESILTLNGKHADTLIILKALAKCFIINSTNLIKQQSGERKIIEELFHIYKDAVSNSSLHIMLPARSREELRISNIIDVKDPRAIRIIADAISGLTDTEAIVTYSVVKGIQPGSIFDRISF